MPRKPKKKVVTHRSELPVQARVRSGAGKHTDKRPAAFKRLNTREAVEAFIEANKELDP